LLGAMRGSIDRKIGRIRPDNSNAELLSSKLNSPPRNLNHLKMLNKLVAAIKHVNVRMHDTTMGNNAPLPPHQQIQYTHLMIKIIDNTISINLRKLWELIGCRHQRTLW
jgi:hypothetical protein